jgi:hypothetical protein
MQQGKMAAYFKAILGDLLLKEYIDDQIEDVLPSPEAVCCLPCGTAHSHAAADVIPFLAAQAQNPAET